MLEPLCGSGCVVGVTILNLNFLPSFTSEGDPLVICKIVDSCSFGILSFIFLSNTTYDLLIYKYFY